MFTHACMTNMLIYVCNASVDLFIANNCFIYIFVWLVCVYIFVIFPVCIKHKKINCFRPTQKVLALQLSSDALEPCYCMSYIIPGSCLCRASIEPNFHDLYLKFLDKVNSKTLNKEIVQATYENCKVCVVICCSACTLGLVKEQLL